MAFRSFRSFSALLALCVLIGTASAVAADPAPRDDTRIVVLSCRMSAPQAEPFTLTLDLGRGEGEDGAGGRYGLTTYRDGFGLWDRDQGRSALVYRLDAQSGRLIRVAPAPQDEGHCDVSR